MSLLPLQPIYIANTIPHLVNRVQQIIGALNNYDQFIHYFGTIDVHGQPSPQANIVADVANTVINIYSSNNLIITTNNAPNVKSLTFNSHTFGTIETAGSANLVANNSNIALTFIASNGLNITTNTNNFSVTFTPNGVGLLSVIPLANTTTNGLMSFVNQSFAGIKTFTGNTVLENANLTGIFQVTGNVNVAGILQISGTGFFGGSLTANSGLILHGTLSANGGIGSGGQVLTSQGGAAYWANSGGGGGPDDDTMITANGSMGNTGQVLVSGGNGGLPYWSSATFASSRFVANDTVLQSWQGGTPIIIVPSQGPNTLIVFLGAMCHDVAAANEFTSNGNVNFYYSTAGGPGGTTNAVGQLDAVNLGLLGGGANGSNRVMWDAPELSQHWDIDYTANTVNTNAILTVVHPWSQDTYANIEGSSTTITTFWTGI